MTVGRLMALLARFDSRTEVYVYDEHADQEREIESVDRANELMTPGVVIDIRSVK